MKREQGLFSGLLILALAGLMTFLPLSAWGRSPVDFWVSKVVKAYGGAKALRGIKTIVYRGKIDATMRRDHGREEIFFERPRRLRVLLTYSRSIEDRLLNGRRGWRNSGEGFVEVKGPPLEAMVFQYQHLDLPLGLIEGKYRISVSEVKRKGRRLPVLNLTGAQGGPPMAVTIDPDTGLILHVAGIFRVAGGTTRLEVDYGDYRRVDGVMLPHRIVNYAAGMEIARTLFDQVQLNKPLDSKVFSPVDIPAD